jgi:hypothetical protein
MLKQAYEAGWNEALEKLSSSEAKYMRAFVNSLKKEKADGAAIDRVHRSWQKGNRDLLNEKHRHPLKKAIAERNQRIRNKVHSVSESMNNSLESKPNDKIWNLRKKMLKDSK